MTIAKNDYEVPTIGTTQIVLAHVFDIGMQQSDYQGVDKIQHRVIMCFELDELMKDGRPFMLSKYLTLSLHEMATLSTVVEALLNRDITDEDRDEGIELESLIGRNCLGTIAATNTGKRKISGFAPLMKSMQPIEIKIPEPSEAILGWIERERAKVVTGGQKKPDNPYPPPMKPDDSDIPF